MESCIATVLVPIAPQKKKIENILKNTTNERITISCINNLIVSSNGYFMSFEIVQLYTPNPDVLFTSDDDVEHNVRDKFSQL